MAVYTLFSQGAAGTLAADNTVYSFGVQFTVSQAATLTAIWWYSASGVTTGGLPTTIGLYAVSGQAQLASQAPSWSGAAGSGWVRAPFTSPPSLTAGTSYKGCAYNSGGSSGNWYSSTASYFASSGVTNGPLSAPANAGGDGGQDTFTSGGGALAYPASSFNATNYWLDVEVTTAAAPAVTVAYSMRSFP